MTKPQNLNQSVRLEVCFSFECKQNRSFLKYLNRTPNYTSRQKWGQLELILKGCMHCCSIIYDYNYPNTDFNFCKVYNICLQRGALGIIKCHIYLLIL